MTTENSTRGGSPSGSALCSSLTDERIAELFEGTNFGPGGGTPEGRRGLMVECVLKQAAGYAEGNTINTICMEAGLLNGRWIPSKAAMRWAFLQIYQSGTTIVERLSQTNDRPVVPGD